MATEFLGARGSNTGDDFHEWWALRKVLQLLDLSTKLTSVKIEGVILSGESLQTLSAWDAVDCSYYFGGDTMETADSVTIEQLKYSSSTPDKNWTVTDFTHSEAKKKNNSIIKKLAESFEAATKLNVNLLKKNKLKIKLVSNRPMGQDLLASLGNEESGKYEKLRTASELNKTTFKKFLKVLDFSDCKTGSRFVQEEQAILEIQALTQDASRGFVLDLKDRVHKEMLPEATDSYVTKTRLLSWMNISDISVLMPCPPRLKKAAKTISRSVALTMFNALSDGNQFVCLHGRGGSGKTTVLEEVKAKLPSNSEMVIYDCYGAGTYLESNTYRHKT